MITLLCILATLALGRVLFVNADVRDDFQEISGIMITVVGAVALATYIFVGVTARFVTGPIFIEEFESVRQTVQTARADGEGLEDAALQQKIVEVNRRLAHEQWWRGSDVGFFLPPEIEELEPIE